MPNNNNGTIRGTVDDVINGINQINPAVRLEWDVPTSALLAFFLFLAIFLAFISGGYLMNLNK